MRARAATAPLIALLALLALLGAGCFESDEGGTVSEAVTIGAEEEQTTVGADGATTSTDEEPTETSESTETETTETEATTETGETETETTTEPGGSGGQEFTAARESFTTSCAGCHTLSDAGSTGNIGPNLDETGDDADAIEEQIQKGGGAMPAGLLQGDDARAVAEYIAAVKAG